MKNEIIAWALLFLGVVIVWLVYRAVEIYERIKKSIEELKKEIECHDNEILAKSRKTEINMKDFDLKAAKAGAAVCMRNGKPVRIICTDRVSSKYPVVVLVPDREYEDVEVYTATGKYGVKDFVSDDDLMMRDDDYAEKLARGEYGNHIHEAIEKVDPVVKENSTTDREYLRRELSEKIMVAMIRELAGKSPHSTSNNITVFEAMAADAVSYADALIEELDKKK